MPHYFLGVEGEDHLVEAVAVALDGPVLRLDGAAAVGDWVAALEIGGESTAGSLVDAFVRKHLGRPLVVRVVEHDAYELKAMEVFYDRDGLTDSDGNEVRPLAG